MGDKTKGLTPNKFKVTRLDNRHSKGEKHHDCVYYVLDLTHDEFAIPALIAYALACEAEYPALAHDIEGLIYAHKRGSNPFTSNGKEAGI